MSSIEEIILKNITTLEEKAKGNKSNSKRSILNKWFQDTVKAYIMEKLAAPLLMSSLAKASTKAVRQFINNELSKDYPVYMSLILKYFELIVVHEKENDFKYNLLAAIYSYPDTISDCKNIKYNDEKKIRQSFVCLLIYKFFMKYLVQKNVDSYKSFFQIWKLSFPEKSQIQRRRNFCQMKKQQIEQIDINKNSGFLETEETSNNYYLQSTVEDQISIQNEYFDSQQMETDQIFESQNNNNNDNHNGNDKDNNNDNGYDNYNDNKNGIGNDNDNQNDNDKYNDNDNNVYGLLTHPFIRDQDYEDSIVNIQLIVQTPSAYQDSDINIQSQFGYQKYLSDNYYSEQILFDNDYENQYYQDNSYQNNY